MTITAIDVYEYIMREKQQPLRIPYPDELEALRKVMLYIKDRR
jgi:hypothetical protein